MATIKVRDGQSLYDIAVQIYGDITGVFWLLADNGLATEDDISAGQELTVRDEYINQIAVYLRTLPREINNNDILPKGLAYPLAVRLIEVRNEKLGNDGYIRIGVSGGQAPYSYRWSNMTYAQSLVKAAAGTYTVVVEDYNGSTVELTATIGTDNVDNYLLESSGLGYILTQSGDRIRMNTTNL